MRNVGQFQGVVVGQVKERNGLGQVKLAFPWLDESVRFAKLYEGDGFINNVSLYLRMLHPRKSNPSLMCVIWVFSGDRASPRSARNSTTAGLTSCSSHSFELPVIIKSSA